MLSAATTLLLCEFFVRYLQDTIPDRPDTPYMADADCGYTLRPSPPGEFADLDDRHVSLLTAISRQ